MSPPPCFFAEHFARHPVLAIIRDKSAQEALDIAHACWASGVRLVEIALDPWGAALDVLGAVAAEADDGARAVGAGTVIRPEQVSAARQAGATFTLSPGFDLDVVQEAQRLGMPTLPGISSATEAQAALRAGLTEVKLFPASLVGPGWIRAMHGPFPQLKIVAVGGIDASNFEVFLDSGAIGVGVASNLDPRMLERARALP